MEKELKKENVGTEYILTFITNFKIIKNLDKTISISFNYAAASTQEREFDIYFRRIFGKCVLDCNTFYDASRIEVYQIP